MTMLAAQNTELANDILSSKYLQDEESFEEGIARLADTLSDNDKHRAWLYEILFWQRFLFAGRVFASVGARRVTTAFNCFVSGEIEDSMDSIFEKLAEAAETMRRGGGIGFDFSNLRPEHDRVVSLDSTASGPVSFAKIYDAMCQTVSSVGHRRGAMMLVLRVDHPDIMKFIHAKRDNATLTGFNISVGITDEFMEALDNDETFDLKFGGKVYETVKAKALWNEIMRNNWDWAEPGVIFLDTINKKNNLWYCETISATNPCGEQPLPPYGACLLGSVNLVKYLEEGEPFTFDYLQLAEDLPHIVRALDNVIDETTYPLEKQKVEAKNKRRMGIGVTGLANALELMGKPYGSEAFLEEMKRILILIRDTVYMASVDLAIEKGPFPYFLPDMYKNGQFIRSLPQDIQDAIERHGIRNSHLLSIAPTGTISLSAGNVSSGAEPVFANGLVDRYVLTKGGDRRKYQIMDWAELHAGWCGRDSSQVTAEEHVKVLTTASQFVDSAVSKTCNVGDDVTFEEFENIYRKAYDEGASGCTTFRLSGKRFGIMEKTKEEIKKPPVEACYIDPETGMRTCDE